MDSSTTDDKPAVAYFRLGLGGPGLEAQIDAVAQWCANHGYTTVSSRQEVETGPGQSRPELALALHLAKQRGATLVIAKLDRLTRDTRVLRALVDSRLAVRVADMPGVDQDVLALMCWVTRVERALVRRRIKEGLAASRAQGTVLGAYGLALATDNRRRAEHRVGELKPVLAALRGQCGSLREMCRQLTAQGVPTADGGSWHPNTVRRLLRRAQLALPVRAPEEP